MRIRIAYKPCVCRPCKTEYSQKMGRESVQTRSNTKTGGQLNEYGVLTDEMSGMHKNDIHSSTIMVRSGRSRKIGNKNIESKLDSSTEEVIYSSENVSSTNVNSSRLCYICYEEFISENEFQDHLSVRPGKKQCKTFRIHSQIHTGKNKDENTQELKSDINIEQKTARVRRSDVLRSKQSEKFIDESSVCNFCKTGFADPKLLESHSKAHLSEKPWVCNHCKEPFLDKTALQLHYRKSHDLETNHWICQLCKKRFKLAGGLNQHLLIHAGKKSFKCSTCGREFTQRSGLQAHARTHMREKPFKCSFCDMRFAQKGTIRIHKSTHTGETIFKCNFCGRGFNRKKIFVLHVKSHSGEKETATDKPNTSKTQKLLNFNKNCENKMANISKELKSLICNYCKTGFAKTNQLELHAKSHTDVNPWLCNTCPEKFTKQAELKSHRRISHAGEKPWICHESRKRFRSVAQLNNHLVIHIQMRPFKCSVCKKGFNQKQSLRKHEMIHSGEMPYMCTFCNQRFRHVQRFKKHARLCVNVNTKIRPIVELEKPVQEESSESETELQNNKIIKPHAENKMAAASEKVQNKKSTKPFHKSTICIHCKTEFFELKALKVHIQSSHREENPWICNHCPKKFQNKIKLEFHQRISHTGEKRWICHKCKKRFNNRSVLKKHWLIHTGEQPYKCNICIRRFNQKTNLRVHSRVHKVETEKPYICELCNKRFKYRKVFKIHMQKCLPKTHESSGNFIYDEENVENVEVRLNEIVEEKIQVTKIVHEFCNDGSDRDSLTPKISEEVQNENSTNPSHKSTICTFCKIGFLEAETFKMHIKSSHGDENPWGCNHCQRKFQNQSKFNYHHRISHTGEKRWICHKCKKRFKDSCELKKHLFVHTGEKPFTCNVCKRRFNQITNLRVHQLRAHTGETPYICRLCHQRYTSGKDLKIHMQKCLPKTNDSAKSSFCEEEIVKTDEEPLNEISDEKNDSKIQAVKIVYECSNDISGDICTKQTCCSTSLTNTSDEVQNKKSTTSLQKSGICFYCRTGFLEPLTLKVHIQSYHMGENPWICNHCQEKLQNESKLKYHNRFSHTGEKHFICHKCKKRFKDRSELNNHLLVHTGEKPHKCNSCKSSFSKISHLRVHSRLHTGEKPYLCGYGTCQQRFKSRREIRVHIRKCLPKTHESSEGSLGKDENVNNQEVHGLKEVSDEKSELEIQVTKIAHELSNDGSENFAPAIPADIYIQKRCSSSNLSTPANTKAKNYQDEFDKIEIDVKSSEPEEFGQSIDIDTTACTKLGEENRRQEWTSFLKVFNVKVARTF